jgi:hypothetical protein
MVTRLLGGWISDDDVTSVRTLLSNTSLDDLALLRTTLLPLVNTMTSTRQAGLVYDALMRGTGAHATLLEGDTEIRAWIASATRAQLTALATGEKIRFVDRLMSGVVSAEDMTAIETVIGSVADPAEMAELRRVFEPRATELGFPDRTRLRGALSREIAPVAKAAPEPWGEEIVARREPVPADVTARAAADVARNGSRRLIDSADARYMPALWELLAAKTGEEDGRPVSDRRRLELLTAARTKLQPLIAALDAQPERKRWVDTELRPFLAALDQSLNLGIARERVRSAATGTLPDLPLQHERHVRADAEKLAEKIRELPELVKLLNENAVRFNEHEIEHAAHAALQGKLPPEIAARWNGRASLVELGTFLMTIEPLLKLTDEEVQERLREWHGAFGGAANLAELVKYGVEMMGGTLGLTFAYAAAVARLSGDVKWATSAGASARMIGLGLADVVAGIEVLHGILVMLDPHATAEHKDEALKEIAVGGAWLGVKYLGRAAYTRILIAQGMSAEAAAEAAAAAVTTFAAAASLAALITYGELRFLARLYGRARTSIPLVFMHDAWETMSSAGTRIAGTGRELATAMLLGTAEAQGAQAGALRQVRDELTARLRDDVASFLEQCEPKPIGEGGYSARPGSYAALARRFAPLLPLRDAKSLDAVAAAAVGVLDAIRTAFENAAEVEAEEAGLERRPTAGHGAAAPTPEHE